MRRLRVGRPRGLLVVAPHPDDETIGAHGLIRAARARGATVRVLVVSDGAGSHPSSRRWPRARLVRARARETRAAMAGLGVGAGAIRFLGLPDGRVTAAAARAGIARAIAAVPRPLLVAGPHGGDDHADHRAVATALARCGRAGVRYLAYPVWPAGRALPRARALPLGPARLAKARALGRYRTQAGAITDDPAGFAMTRAQRAAFARAAETFVEQPR